MNLQCEDGIMDEDERKLKLLTAWTADATLPQLVIELQKTAARDKFEGKNMEAVSVLSNAIITRFG